MTGPRAGIAERHGPVHRAGAARREAAALAPVGARSASTAILSLQRIAGNRATADLVGRLRSAHGADRADASAQQNAVSRPTLAASLTPTDRDDPREREADRAAQAALSGATTSAGEQSPPTGLPRSAAPSAMRLALGPGAPLPGPTRSRFEGLFGKDLSGVRVHSHPGAAASARELGASAFTVGHDIVFGADRFRPDTGAGDQLLAHELAHVALQHSAGPCTTALRQTDPNSTSPTKPKPTVNVFPFGSLANAFRRDYLDERVTAIQVNLMVGKGVVYLTVEAGKEPLVVELSAFEHGTVDLVPILPPQETLAAAKANVPPAWLEGFKQGNMVACFFYRGPGGLIWPSLLNEQTLPRIMPTLRQVEAAQRQDARATAEGFANLLLWYVGARFPIRTKVPKTTAAAPAASALNSLSPLQRTVAAEAQAILRSKEIAQIRAAHAAGKSVEVVINGRTIVYEPGLSASGMTLFGENGFVIGREAFKSSSELTKTLLHELHRLATSASKAKGVSGALAAAETANAATFADDLFALGVKLGMW